MSILIYQNEAIAGAAVSTLVSAQIIARPRSVIGFEASKELYPVYHALGKMTHDGMLDWSDIKAYSLSEHVKSDASETISEKLSAELYSRVNLAAEHVYKPDNSASNWSEACSSYEGRIMAAGGMDLIVLTVGADGSIAYNLPSGELAPVTHVERTNDGRVVTIGISTVMSARRVIAYMSGSDKASIAEAVISGPVTPMVPASYLQLHQDAIFILDEAAAASLH